MKNITILFLILITIFSCTDEKDKKVYEIKEKTLKSEDYITEEAKQYFEIETDTIRVDTTFIYKSDTIQLSILSYSLNDSSLLYNYADTIDNVITNHKSISHNSNIDINVKYGDELISHSFKKTDLKALDEDYFIKSCSKPKVKINQIMNSSPEILINLFMCYPGTCDCRGWFALINWQKDGLDFSGFDGIYCDSDAKSIEGKSILSCDGFFDYKGNKKVDFINYNVVLSEYIDANTFIVVNDLVTHEEIKDSNKYKSIHDSISDNTFVYDFEGNVKYSFRFDGYFEPFNYQCYKIKTDSLNQLFLIDIEKEKYFIPKSNKVEVYNLKTINETSNLELYKKYKFWTPENEIDGYVKGDELLIDN